MERDAFSMLKSVKRKIEREAEAARERPLPRKVVLFAWARMGLTTVRALVIVVVLVALKVSGVI